MAPESGLIWFAPVAVATAKTLAVWGLNLWGVAELGIWIADHFSTVAEADASVPDATRVYYSELAARWGDAAAATLEPARLGFFSPVAGRAIQLIESPETTHAEIGAAVAQLAAYYDRELAAQGGPIGEIVGGQAAPVPPAGALANLPDPLGTGATAKIARSFLFGAGVAGLLLFGLWKYGD